MQKAGTSVAVVSYGINNGPAPVAETTRQRVLQAIKKPVIDQWHRVRWLRGVRRLMELVAPRTSPNPFIASMKPVPAHEALLLAKYSLLGDAGDSSCVNVNSVITATATRG